MKVYFYDIIDLEKRMKEWENKDFPGHLLYGLTHLEKYDLKPVFQSIPFNPYKSRLRLMFYNLRVFLFPKEKFDIIYGVTHRGLELIILLRALKLYRKPIIIWHHSAVIEPSQKIHRFISRIFYRGIDKMFFFSQALLDASFQTGKLKKENGYVIHWGPDLSFYDHLGKVNRKSFFISTGRENRDFQTLIKAFGQTSYNCEIYTAACVGHQNYEEQLKKELQTTISPNVKIFFVNSSLKDIAEKVNEAFAVVICCLEYPYTVGLTTLVEALALGLPVITTDNPTFPFDVEKEKVGLKVPYGDAEGWIKAIDWLAKHPEEMAEMGERGRLLAENSFNLEDFAREVAEVLNTIR